MYPTITSKPTDELDMVRAYINNNCLDFQTTYVAELSTIDFKSAARARSVHVLVMNQEGLENDPDMVQNLIGATSNLNLVGLPIFSKNNVSKMMYNVSTCPTVACDNCSFATVDNVRQSLLYQFFVGSYMDTTRGCNGGTSNCLGNVFLSDRLRCIVEKSDREQEWRNILIREQTFWSSRPQFLNVVEVLIQDSLEPFASRLSAAALNIYNDLRDRCVIIDALENMFLNMCSAVVFLTSDISNLNPVAKCNETILTILQDAASEEHEEDFSFQHATKLNTPTNYDKKSIWIRKPRMKNHHSSNMILSFDRLLFKPLKIFDVIALCAATKEEDNEDWRFLKPTGRNAKMEWIKLTNSPDRVAQNIRSLCLLLQIKPTNESLANPSGSLKSNVMFMIYSYLAMRFGGVVAKMFYCNGDIVVPISATNYIPTTTLWFMLKTYAYQEVSIRTASKLKILCSNIFDHIKHTFLLFYVCGLHTQSSALDVYNKIKSKYTVLYEVGDTVTVSACRGGMSASQCAYKFHVASPTCKRELNPDHIGCKNYLFSKHANCSPTNESFLEMLYYEPTTDGQCYKNCSFTIATSPQGNVTIFEEWKNRRNQYSIFGGMDKKRCEDMVVSILKGDDDARDLNILDIIIQNKPSTCSLCPHVIDAIKNLKLVCSTFFTSTVICFEVAIHEFLKPLESADFKCRVCNVQFATTNGKNCNCLYDVKVLHPTTPSKT